MDAARFAGRDGELTQLEQLLEDASQGRGASLLVSAPPGMGKTRLLREFQTRVEPRCRWFALGGNLHSTQSSYAPFREALGGEFRQVLASLEGTAVIVIEDLQWADADTLALIGAINRHVSDLPLLMIGTISRPEFGRYEPSAELARTTPTFKHVMELGPLSAVDVRNVVHEMVRAEPGLSAEMIVRVERAGGGNPGHIEELVRAAARATTLGLAPALVVPASIEAAVIQRYTHLSLEMQGALLRAAVLGPSFDARVLARILVRGEDEVASTLQSLCEMGILGATGVHNYTFVTPLVCDVVYAQATPAMRMLVHASAARILEERGYAASARELSDHWYASNEPERSIGYARQAADAAFNAGEYEESARFYERVLQFTVDGGIGRATLLRSLAQSLYFGGALLRSRSYFEMSAEEFLHAGRSEVAAEMLASLAAALWNDGDSTTAFEVIEAALPRFGGGDADGAVAQLLIRGAEMFGLIGTHDRSRALLSRVESLLPDLAIEQQVRYHHALGKCLTHQGQFGAAISQMDCAFALLRKNPDVGLMAAVSHSASICYRFAGHFAIAEGHARRALRYARRQNAGPLVETKLALVHADLLAIGGNLPEALELLEWIVKRMPDSGMWRIELASVVVPIALATDRDDLVNACFDESLIDEAFATGIPFIAGAAAYAAACVAQAHGDLKSARAILSKGLRALVDAHVTEPLLLAIAEYGDQTDFAQARALLEGLRECEATPALLLLFDALVAHRSEGLRKQHQLAEAAAERLKYLHAPLWMARALELSGKQKSALEVYRDAGAEHHCRRLERLFADRGRRKAGSLTRRHTEIGRLIAAGEPNRAIASKLQISSKTLETHLTAIYQRLGVPDRAALARYFLGHIDTS